MMANKAGRRQRAHERRLARGLEKTFRHNMLAQRSAFASKLAEAKYIAEGGDPKAPFRPFGDSLKYRFMPITMDELERESKPMVYDRPPFFALLPKASP